MLIEIVVKITFSNKRRYDVMLKSWNKDATKRPTFTEIVSHFQEGVLPGTARADEDGEYVLLGPEENVLNEQRARTDTILSKTSKMDITMINPNQCAPSSFNGTSFDVVFLCPSGKKLEKVAAQPDLEYYMEMNSLPREGSVFVNQAAELHEYDNIAEGLGESKKSEADSHVTYSSDHVTHTKENRINELNSEYIIMQSAEPALPDIKK